MKICFITSNIANIGGQERVLANLLNGLVTIKDIEVSILFTSPKKCLISLHTHLIKE